MSRNRLKILLWVENNFHSLLLEKEISTQIPDSTILLIHSGREIKHIIEADNFDLLIFDYANKYDQLDNLMRCLKKTNRAIEIIALKDPGSESGKNNRYLHTFYKKQNFYIEIVKSIKQLLNVKISKEVDLSVLSQLRTSQTEMLKITTGSLKHEINNPLMAILSVCELIMDDRFKYDRELIKKIKIIQKSARRIHNSLNDIAKISAPQYIETGSGLLLDRVKSHK